MAGTDWQCSSSKKRNWVHITYRLWIRFVNRKQHCLLMLTAEPKKWKITDMEISQRRKHHQLLRECEWRSKLSKSKSNQTREKCLQLAKQTPGLVRCIRSSPSLFFFIAPIVLLLIRCCSPFPVVEAQISPLGCCAPARNALLPVLPYNLIQQL